MAVTLSLPMTIVGKSSTAVPLSISWPVTIGKTAVSLTGSLNVYQAGNSERKSMGRAKHQICASIRDSVSNNERIAGARKSQMQATELFAELLKTNDVKAVAKEHVDSLTESFFTIASTYLDLAKKEGNIEIVNKLETTLQTALSVKEATLRPEIRLLNQLLRQDETERSETIQSNSQYLTSGSYFYQLLSRMIADVEKQTNNPRRLQLLAQLRIISKETKEVSKPAKKSKGFGSK